MTQDTPSRSLDKVIVRLPDGMRDRIREAAEKNNRSMNAEIVSRLDNSFIQEFWDAKAPFQLAKERSLQEDAIQQIIEQTVLQLSDVLGLDKSKLNLKK
ncbi:Arc family DNA-binding protein [Pseudochrobactrum asaccharolyticum]|uniref:Arc-like DNA binding dprotein n=1 Tax=Pseudochrobactrum asaccharolyticum TaxID=354351 RepID=A0A366DM63_9HYPH|nr:Arc family DNA-binding protein [Pseudochrobactrum asaccharolyticum]RBO91025.1 Arc-like DNA binding dprotein [Pseudochrobactrum asaccharolyticum]